MTNTLRHVKALSKKNFIIWKRSPICSGLQLFCPALLMLILVYIRTKIHASTAIVPNLEITKHPLFPAFEYNVNSHTWTKDWGTTSARQKDFFLYDNYTTQTNDYKVEFDFSGPAFMTPSMCEQSNSFVQPQVGSYIIAYVDHPSNVQTAFINYLEKQLGRTFPEYQLQEFASKQAIWDYTSAEDYLYQNGKAGICFGFEIVEKSASDFALSLFFNDQTLMSSQRAVGIPSQLNPSWSPTATSPNTNAYEQYGFRFYALMQNLAANIILKEQSGKADATISAMIVPEYVDDLQEDTFSQILAGILPLFMLVMYMPMVFMLVFNIVKEKESRAKESMRMMGMGDFSYWLSWFIYYSLVNTIAVSAATGVLAINVVQYTELGYIWLFLWLYGEAIFGQIVTLQALFQTASFSGIIATLVYFGGSMIIFTVQSTALPVWKRALAGILPQVNSQLMAAVFASFESAAVGINSDTVSQLYGNYSFLIGLWMMLISLIFFTAFGLYLDKVLPKKYGQRLSPFFPCMPSFWGCGRRGPHVEDLDEDEGERRTSLLLTNNLAADKFELQRLKRENYEPVAAEIARQELEEKILKLGGLVKTYENGFQAVKGLNIKMYSGQIFALLGQNGAGKSTTISMLTGLLSRTAGAATVFGRDLFSEMGAVRQFMGVCPQHDVLFDQLTPEEHLDIFFDFKGGDPLTKRDELRNLIRDVGVATDKDKPASSLSGGNRRKLSVAIALCGGSKLVLLDEPTAGMDLSARRGLWDMLRSYRRDRIIILTTHYMDEADVLGDRIGIMAHGELMCLGSSLFLKNRFGTGYKLTMVKKFKSPNTKVESYLKERLGKVEKLSEVASEITFQIDNSSAHLFKTFFDTFDQQLDSLDLVSYGISITTLEEVFLKINAEFRSEKPEIAQLEQDDEFEKIQDRAGLLKNPQEKAEEMSENLVHDSTVCSNVGALLTKRFHIYKRDKTGFCCEVLVPFLLVLFGCGLTKINWLVPSDPKTLETSLFPHQRILMNEDLIVNSLALGAVSPQDLFSKLPDSSSAFTVSYSDITDYYTFYNATWDARNDGERTPYRYGNYQIYDANTQSQQWQFSSFINMTSQDASVLYPQFMYESILKTATGNDNFSFKVTTEAFPVFYVFQQRINTGAAFDYAFLVGIGLSLIPIAMVRFILREREQNLKHMQLISGMNLAGYWIANVVADIIKAYIPIIMMIIVAEAFELNYEGIWLAYLCFPPAIVGFSYFTTFLFTKDTTAQIVTLFIHFFLASIGPTLVYTLQLIPQTAMAGDQLRWWFCLVPSFCVTHAILISSSLDLLLYSRSLFPATNSHDKPYKVISSDLWAVENLTGDLYAMGAWFVVGILLLIIIECNVFACLEGFTLRTIPGPDPSLVLDEDVIKEEERIKRMGPYKQTDFDNEKNESSDVIRVENFRKAYTTLLGKPFVAVERCSFGLDYGECFALLGVNGAGKSTTFKSVTRDTKPTTGKITVQGFDIQRQFGSMRKLVGYCPQHDAIFELMTVEEHLWFYARIKGIPRVVMQSVVEKSILEMSLEEHRTKVAGSLSGGNKRKLSVAIATLGNPPIILLDEPSAGMDPEARRFMWTVVAKISQRDKKSAVILTTHSMEEAEALSTKMGIMVRGGIFRCFGSSQHIKNKYGTGYELEIKIKKPTYERLQQLAASLEIPFESLEGYVDLTSSLRQCSSHGVDAVIIEQIKANGIGSDLALEAVQSGEGKVRLKNLVSYMYTQTNGLRVIDFLVHQFEQVELLEQVSDFFKIRVPKGDKTIGYLFGSLEQKKADFCIAEYAVSQTSLEQIFQQFANLNIDEKAAWAFTLSPTGHVVLENPDKRMTTRQKASLSLTLRPSMDKEPRGSSLNRKDDEEGLLKNVGDHN